MNQTIYHNNNSEKNAKYLYLKYKSKYLRLKKIVEIYGGTPSFFKSTKEDKVSSELKGIKLEKLKTKSYLYPSKNAGIDEYNEKMKAINKGRIAEKFKTVINSSSDDQAMIKKLDDYMKNSNTKNKLIQQDESKINTYVKKIIEINAINGSLNYHIDKYIKKKEELTEFKKKMDENKKEIEDENKKHDSELETINHEYTALLESKEKSKQENKKLKKEAIVQPGKGHELVTKMNEEEKIHDKIEAETTLKIKAKELQFNSDTQKYKLENEENEKKYIDLSNGLLTGIKKINYLHKKCIDENIELFKLNINNNDIINLNLKHGDTNKINCFEIPDINKSLDEIRRTYEIEKMKYKFR